jgi:16S rRNA (guanine527-N7)-methyltransferase
LTKKIQTALERLGHSYPDDTAEKLGTLIDELERWNRKVNLTAIRDRDEMITSHLLDSLSAGPLLEGERILDVGTGPGFPGLPLAIVHPERQFTLLDSNNKKIMFAQHVAGMLDLDNVSAVKARGEDYAPGHGFDTVIARAVAALPRLVEIAGHHVREDGVFVALKGRYPEEELEALVELDIPWNHAVTELDVPGLEKGSRHAVLLRRHNTG